MRHHVGSAGRGKEGCILLRESVSSVNILLLAFLLITGISCYGQHCCKPINIHDTLQKHHFLFWYPFFSLSGSGTKRNRKRQYGVSHVFNDSGKTISSLFYCCNFYGNFKCLLAEIHWPPKTFDNVPGCCWHGKLCCS